MEKDQIERPDRKTRYKDQIERRFWFGDEEELRNKNNIALTLRRTEKRLD